MTAQTNNDFLTHSLHARGRRMTSQRALIMQILQDAGEHLDAEGIWRTATRQDQAINLATVYRNLNLLVASGLVQQSFLGEGQKRAYYEPVDKPRHFHFACLRCGQVQEVTSELFIQAQADIEQRYAVKIQTVHLKFEGLCSTCAAACAAMP